MDKNQQAFHQPAEESQQITDPYQRPITPYDQTLALTYELGEPLEKYMAGPPRGNAVLRWLGFLLLVLIGAGMITGALSVWLDPELYGQGVSAGGIIFPFVIGLIVLMVSLPYSPLWPHIAITYLVCTDGFLRVRPLVFKDRLLAIRWKQVSAYYTDGLRLKLTLQDEADGKERRSVLITLVGNYRRKASRMGSSIVSRIEERIQPQLQRFWQTGEPLTFGPFTVSRAGVQYAEQSFPWEEIKACTIVFKPGGLTFVLGTRESRALARHKCFQIPNVYELKGLIDAELTMRRAEKRLQKGKPDAPEDA